MSSILDDFLNDLDEIYSSMRLIVGNQSGPLTGQNLTDATSLSNQADSVMASIQGIVGNGTANSAYPTGSTLPSYAIDAEALARAAKASGSAGATNVANYIQTIKDRIRTSYRTAAGIT